MKLTTKRGPKDVAWRWLRSQRLETSSPSQDRETGTTFTHRLETTRKRTKYFEQWFLKHWTLSNKGQWETGNKQGNRTTETAYCLDGISRLQNKKHGARESLVVSLSWGDRSGSTRRPRCWEFATKEKVMKAENSEEMLGFPLHYSLINLCVYVN